MPRHANQTSFSPDSARAAVAARWKKCEDRTEATAPAREVAVKATKARAARLKLDAYVRTIVDRAPELTADQVAHLASILPATARPERTDRQDVA